MPIKSYVAFTTPDQSQSFEQELSRLDDCDVIASKNRDVFIVVTDCMSEEQDENLLKKIHEIQSLSFISLVGVWDQPQ